MSGRPVLRAACLHPHSFQEIPFNAIGRSQRLQSTIRTAIAFIGAIVCLPVFAASDCDAKDKEGFSAGMSVPGYDAGREVVGSGRLQFHSAPDSACRLPGVFILPGEKVIAYAEHKGYTSVMYINSRTKEDTMGWVDTTRLKRTGKGISPRQ